MSGHEVVRTIRSALHKFGRITSFKAYRSSNQPLSGLNSELGSSGVTLVDCPSNGRKEAATIRMISLYFECSLPFRNLMVYFASS